MNKPLTAPIPVISPSIAERKLCWLRTTLAATSPCCRCAQTARSDMATDVKQHEGSGIKEQQKGPHAHCIILDRSERHALAADLGIDKVMIYRFDRATGKLTSGQTTIRGA